MTINIDFKTMQVTYDNIRALSHVANILGSDNIRKWELKLLEPETVA